MIHVLHQFLLSRTCVLAAAVFFTAFHNAAVLHSQERPPEFVRQAVADIEAMLDAEGDSSIVYFIEHAMAGTEPSAKDSLIEKLRCIRQQMQGLGHDIAVEAAPGGLLLIMSSPEEEKRLKIVLDCEAETITGLSLVKGPEPIHLTAENVSETFLQLEKQGMAGVVYIRLKGKVILERGFGPANRDLGIPNTLDTVFGTGSRPIDYTIAAVLLLDQQGLLSLEDSVTEFFSHVPRDKQTITIGHLLTGQSGLPDFFHTDDDWDPDLAWIDRTSAVDRLLSQNLLFEPGAMTKHSHGAFGLLAAVIEKVTGETYYRFIHENFFDPAGMKRTGEYGETLGLALSDFAAGSGPQRVGLPNIPPNWGPVSWLIKGSGGMYSTLGDQIKFYEYIRSGRVLDAGHRRQFLQPAVNLDGSDRGFELFSAFFPPDNEVYLLLNDTGDRGKARQVYRALERLARPGKK